MKPGNHHICTEWSVSVGHTIFVCNCDFRMKEMFVLFVVHAAVNDMEVFPEPATRLEVDN